MTKISKKFHIIVIGCQMNKSDSERIAQYMENLGFEWSDDKFVSDYVFITTCGVRQSAEDRIYGIIPKIKKENPQTKIILTGCLSERKDVIRRLEGKVDIWLPIRDLSKLADKLGIDKKDVAMLDEYLSYAPKYESKFSAFVPIGNGCDNFCSYCVVPYARGREKYRSSDEVLNEVSELLKKGYKEITLIAQNVNSYFDKEKSLDFPDLLRAVNDLEGDFWLRFATSHPKDMSDKLIQTIADCKKVCEHIHLPAQAGDNTVLKNMNRKYTIEHYKGLLDKIRTIINPEKTLPVSITTDIIVGFPGETNKHFEKTRELFTEVKYDMAYIAQYSTRPGTASAKMEDDVEKNEKKYREEVLMDILRKTSLENNQWYKDKTVEVLIEGVKKDGRIYGKTRSGKVVKAENKDQKIDKGDIIKITIEKVDDFGLYGKINKD